MPPPSTSLDLAVASCSKTPTGRSRERPVVYSRPSSLLDLDDVLGGRPLRTLHDVELHPVTLGEAAEPLRLDGGVVDKAILVPILRSDETKTFCVVEPLHRAEGASHLLLHVDLPASVPGGPDSRVFMSAGQSCVIKNEKTRCDITRVFESRFAGWCASDGANSRRQICVWTAFSQGGIL